MVAIMFALSLFWVVVSIEPLKILFHTIVLHVCVCLCVCVCGCMVIIIRSVCTSYYLCVCVFVCVCVSVKNASTRGRGGVQLYNYNFSLSLSSVSQILSINRGGVHHSIGCSSCLAVCLFCLFAWIRCVAVLARPNTIGPLRPLSSWPRSAHADSRPRISSGFRYLCSNFWFSATAGAASAAATAAAAAAAGGYEKKNKNWKSLCILRCCL